VTKQVNAAAPPLSVLQNLAIVVDGPVAGWPLSVLQNLAIVVDGPVAGCARPAPAPRPGEADISIGADRPSSSVAPNWNLPTTIPRKRNVDVGHQPPRRPEQVELVGRRQSSLESAPASRARVRAANLVNAAQFR